MTLHICKLTNETAVKSVSICKCWFSQLPLYSDRLNLKIVDVSLYLLQLNFVQYFCFYMACFVFYGLLKFFLSVRPCSRGAY